MTWSHSGGRFYDPLNLEIAKGNLPARIVYISGKKINLSSAKLDDISQIPNTEIIPNPGGKQLQIVSSSPNDISGGTGARLVNIWYLDNDGVENEERLALNGTTPVDTIATDIGKIQWMGVVEVGSNEVTFGNISLSDGFTIYEYIASGDNQSLTCRYTVPKGKTGHILGWQAGSIDKVADIRLRATVSQFDRSLQAAFNSQDVVTLDTTVSGWIPFSVPLTIPAKATIKVSGLSSAGAGGDASASFNVLLLDD